MTTEQQEKELQFFQEAMKRIILSKRHDYAGSDVLSNFKKAGSICNLTPEQNCLSLIATKVARLGELLSDKKPNNESIEDTIIDLANYSFLLHCIKKAP
jgi:hypothetical protein